MRWYRAKTYALAVVGTDATRNPVTELRETGNEILARSAPWAATHTATDGNGFDLVERTLLTKASQELLEGIAAIEYRGTLYEVVNVNHEAPTAAITVRTAKDGV